MVMLAARESGELTILTWHIATQKKTKTMNIRQIVMIAYLGILFLSFLVALDFMIW